jgi:putative heme-binding domain-containing protein
LINTNNSPAAAIAALHVLNNLGVLAENDLMIAEMPTDSSVQVAALQLADQRFNDTEHVVAASLVMCRNQTQPEAFLQAALSIGNVKPAKHITKSLAGLAESQGDLRWMDAAIASSAYKIEKDVIIRLALFPGKGEPVMNNLAGIIAARGDAKEITETLTALRGSKASAKTLEILQLGLEDTKPLANKADIPAPTAPTAEQNATWEKRVPAILAALKQKPNLDEGKTLFQGICGACHKSHGIGSSVGPDLDAEFQRAPEVILRDVLFPSEAARPGYETIMAKTKRGETLLGITASDSPTSITLKLTGGAERTVLSKRADIRTLRNVSLMPAGLGDALKPEQIANIIAFLRSPP